jgi:2-octaprenyl-6-methoxyphenol hydroxylase
MTDAPEHEIVIVGGGPVGCAAALGFARAQRSTVLLDASPGLKSDDPRTLALSFGSRLILERLDVWGAILPRTEIQRIHVSQRGAFGSTVLTSAEAGTPALGYVTGYVRVQDALQRALAALPHAQLRGGVRVTALEEQDDRVLVSYEDELGNHQLSAALAVIADGGALAQRIADVEVRDYGQSALICNVTSSQPQSGVAFERFTADGPIALLPHGDSYAVVWTVSPERGTDLMQLSADELGMHLQQAFGTRAGRLSNVRDRSLFPLALRVARMYDAKRMVLIGNAAQALHPVAGQGLNLGLRDAWDLAGHLRDAARGELTSLAQTYRRERERDRQRSVFVTDTMVRTFSNNNLPMQWLRGCGLTFLDSFPPAKQRFMRQMMYGTFW